MKTLYTRLKSLFAKEWTVLLGLLVLLPLSVGLLVGSWSGSRLNSFRALEEPAPPPVERRVEPTPQPAPPPVPARKPSLGASGGGKPGRTLEYRWTVSPMAGEDVEALQSRLLRQAGQLGQTGSGVFDLPTQRGVFEFQLGHGLPPTGEVDSATWQALFASPQ